jgi:hypothetical protein
LADEAKRGGQKLPRCRKSGSASKVQGSLRRREVGSRFSFSATRSPELNHAPVIGLACGSAIIAPKVPHCWKPSNQFRGRHFPGPPTPFFLVSVL